MRSVLILALAAAVLLSAGQIRQQPMLLPTGLMPAVNVP
jgi:hypothetical protein